MMVEMKVVCEAALAGMRPIVSEEEADLEEDRETELADDFEIFNSGHDFTVSLLSGLQPAPARSIKFR